CQRYGVASAVQASHAEDHPQVVRGSGSETISYLLAGSLCELSYAHPLRAPALNPPGLEAEPAQLLRVALPILCDLHPQRQKDFAAHEGLDLSTSPGPHLGES